GRRTRSGRPGTRARRLSHAIHASEGVGQPAGTEITDATEERMGRRLNRREFVQTTTAAAAAAAAIPKTMFGQAPAVKTGGARPVGISSSNGNKYNNGGTQTGVEKAFQMITGGSDVLDALIAGVNIVELDPLDDRVGYGGLPNAEGAVSLDSCCMHGP